MFYAINTELSPTHPSLLCLVETKVEHWEHQPDMPRQMPKIKLVSNWWNLVLTMDTKQENTQKRLPLSFSLSTACKTKY